MSFDPSDLEFHEPADWTHPIDLIEPEEEAEETIDVENVGEIPVDAVAAIVRMLVPRCPKSRAGWDAALVKLAVVAWTVLPDVRQHSFVTLSNQLDCTRALLSHYACSLRDWAKLGCRGGKSEAARAIYSERCDSVWRKRKRGQGADGATRPTKSREPS